ncbi:hypothetical protein EL753P1_00054 [Eggerthella phage EL753P1]|jgi:hypothetical protein|nr:hypothetical protein EL753P1_00054 [Eggerthella phage EL753P1]
MIEGIVYELVLDAFAWLPSPAWDALAWVADKLTWLVYAPVDRMLGW